MQLLGTLLCVCVYVCMLLLSVRDRLGSMRMYIELVLLANNRAGIIVTATCIIYTPTFYRQRSYVLHYLHVYRIQCEGI